MAVDSAAKRASALAFSKQGIRSVVPSGSDLNSAGKRQAGSSLYAGIAAGAASTIPARRVYTQRRRRRGWV